MEHFLPLSLQTLFFSCQHMGTFLEPNSLTLCTACSLPEAQLWLKMLISLLLALFSFSVKTCLESAFYSVMYTCMCQPSHTSDVKLRCSKDMLVISMNNWLEMSLAVLIVRCSWVNAKTKALLNVSGEKLVKSLALSNRVSAPKWNLKDVLDCNGFWLAFVMCLSASLIGHSFVKSALFCCLSDHRLLKSSSF